MIPIQAILLELDEEGKFILEPEKITERRTKQLCNQICGPTHNSQHRSYNFTQQLKNETMQKWLATVNAFINQK